MSNPRNVEVYWKVVCGMCLQWWTYCKFTICVIESWIHKRKLHQCYTGYTRHWRLWHASFFQPFRRMMNRQDWTRRLSFAAGNTQVSLPFMPNIAGVLRELPGALWRCHAFPGDSAEPVDFDQDTALENDGTWVDMLGPSNRRSGQC